VKDSRVIRPLQDCLTNVHLAIPSATMALPGQIMQLRPDDTIIEFSLDPSQFKALEHWLDNLGEAELL